MSVIENRVKASHVSHRHDVSWCRKKRRVDGERLSVEDPWPWVGGMATSVVVAEVEKLQVRAARSGYGRELVIASDAAQIELGIGLSKEALEWLEEYLKAAIILG